MWQERMMFYIDWLKTNLPLTGFAFLGALLEEVVAPIPSSVVQLAVGSLAQSQNYPWYMIVLLGVIGAIGNTLGSLLPYGIYRLVGASLVRVLGKYVGLTPDRIGKARDFLQKGARDDVVIFMLRALPFVPILNPSVICGILGIKLSTFVLATFLGYVVRNTYMLTVGFVGIDAIKHGDPKALGLLVSILVIVVLMIFISHRHAKHVEAQGQKTDEV